MGTELKNTISWVTAAAQLGTAYGSKACFTVQLILSSRNPNRINFVGKGYISVGELSLPLNVLYQITITANYCYWLIPFPCALLSSSIIP